MANDAWLSLPEEGHQPVSTYETDEEFAAVDDAEQSREVYALYGLVIYYVQVLEHGIVNFLYVCAIDRGDIKAYDEVDAFYRMSFDKTLGQLLKQLGSTADIDPHLENDLRRARERRNFLVHHYFRVRVNRLATRQGREEMRRELLSDLDDLQRLDSHIDAALFRIGASYGLTEKAVEEKLDQIMKDGHDS